MKKNVLITGVAGLLGSNFADWLIENHPEYHIVGIDNLEWGYYDNVNAKVDFHLRDCVNDIEDIFQRYNFKYVFHFAAYSAEGLSSFVRKFNYSNNIISTANVVNLCIKYDCKLIYTSSMSVYGKGIVPFSEDDVLIPFDPYANGKIACENDIKIAGEQHNLKYAIIRPHNILGIKQNLWDRYRNVVSIFMRQIKQGQPLTIYGSGLQTRAFSWCEDYFPIFLKVAENDYENPVFNCGGDEYYTIKEVAEMLIELTGHTKGIIHLEPRHEVFEAYCDHTKVKSVVGFEPKVKLPEMLTKMWDWVKVQPDRPLKYFERIELEVGLYDFWKKK